MEFTGREERDSSFDQQETEKEPNFLKLKEHILKLSMEKTDFNKAKLEWELFQIHITHEFGRCPCGQKIKEHCHLRNTNNGKKTWVGNICVKKFMNIDSGTMFDGLKRIEKKINAKPNAMLIEYAWKNGYLYGENEYDFLRRIQRKRKISEKQENWLLKINRRILQTIVVRQLPNENDENGLNHDLNSAIGLNSGSMENSENDDSNDAQCITFVPLLPKFTQCQWEFTDWLVNRNFFFISRQIFF